MSNVQVQRGQILDFTATAAVTSGAPVLVGGLLNIPQTSAAIGEKYAGATEGVHELTKESTAVLAVGDLVYWDDTAKEIDVSASGRFEVGTCVADAGNGLTKVKVKLKGFAVPAVP